MIFFGLDIVNIPGKQYVFEAAWHICPNRHLNCIKLTAEIRISSLYKLKFPEFNVSAI